MLPKTPVNVLWMFLVHYLYSFHILLLKLSTHHVVFTDHMAFSFTTSSLHLYPHHYPASFSWDKGNIGIKREAMCWGVELVKM